MYNNIVKTKMKYFIVMNDSNTEESKIVAKFTALGDCYRALDTYKQDAIRLTNISFEIQIGTLKTQKP
jgi:hypothetical protein